MPGGDERDRERGTERRVGGGGGGVIESVPAANVGEKRNRLVTPL